MNPSRLLRQLNLGQALFLAGLLMVTLAISLFIWQSEVRREETTARADFERSVDQIFHALTARMETLQAVMRAGSGLWAEHPDMNANQWNTFVERALLQQGIPGVDALAFAQLVPMAGRDAFVADIRDRLWRNFTIHPAGQNGDFGAVITHVTPLSRTRAVVGFDIASNPTRWQAAQLARDSGDGVLSAPLRLVGQEQGPLSFLLVHPVFAADHPLTTVAQRRQALRGWLLLGLHAPPLIGGVVDRLDDPSLRIRVISGASGRDDTPIYVSGTGENGLPVLFETRRVINVAGAKWTIEARRHLAPSSLWLGPGPLTLLALCVAFSLAATTAAGLLLISRQQSRQLAAQAMGQLSRAERTLAGITASVPGTVFQWQQGAEGGAFTFVSSQSLSMFGVPAETLVKDWRTLPFEPAERESWPQAMAEAASGVGEWSQEGAYLAADGSKRWWRAAASPSPGDNGTTLLNGLFVDITEQKEVQAQLAEREQTYREMFERTSAVKVLVDPDSGKIVDANAAALTYYGYDPDKVSSSGIHQVSLMDDADLQAVMTRSAMGEQQFFRSRHRLASGEIREVEVHLGPVRMQGRRYVHAIVHDVTDRERFQAELMEKSAKLEESNAELQQFSYVVSHDLQEPLRTIASFLRLLERRYDDKLDAEGREFIGFAVDAAHRQQAMIQSLLEYSRIGTRGRPFAPTDMNKVAAIARDNLASAISEAAAEVEIGELPQVNADEMQMVSLLQNLLGNALKYRRDAVPPRIAISAEDQDERWVISVADNGIGIDPQYFDRIFQVFQRLHNREKYSGTGIGLALCRKIVQRHGGDIWVDSRPDQGSVFKFSLPKAVKSGSA